MSCARAAIQHLRAPAEEVEVDEELTQEHPARVAAERSERWLRLARIALLELGTRGPKHPTAPPGQLAHKTAADQSDQEDAAPAPDTDTGPGMEADWRSPQVCLGYLLEQSVTWLEPESDDDLHSPKASVPPAEEEEDPHPAMKAIARQQRAPGLVEGLPKCLSF